MTDFYTTVLYNESPGSVFMSWHPHALMRFAWTGIIHGDGDTAEKAELDAAQEVYELLGNNAESEKPPSFLDRTMSVGDVVIFDGSAYACAGIGFDAISMFWPTVRDTPHSQVQDCPIRLWSGNDCPRCTQIAKVALSQALALRDGEDPTEALRQLDSPRRV